MQRGVLEAVLFEDPARPSFVHVAAAEWLIHAHAGCANAQTGASAGGGRLTLCVKSVRRGTVFHLFAGHVRDRNARALVLAGLERGACALFEQRVQRPGGIGPAIVEYEPGTVP